MDRHETLQLLKQFKIRPSRTLGQNFLVDLSVSERIAAAAELTENDQVIEIGAGLGALTRRLAQLAGRVWAIEIDRHLVPALSQVLADWPACRILQQDVRQIALDSLAADWPGQTVLIGNLPYYITTPLIEQALCDLPMCRRFIFMLQKEAADRLLADPGSKAYGPAAILLALQGPARRLFRVSPAAFWPRPHVDSVVIAVGRQPALDPARMNGQHTARFAADPVMRRCFLRFLEQCFGRRRKKLANNLPVPPQTAAALLRQIGLSADIRPEQVRSTQYLALFAILYRDDGSGHWIDAL